MKKGEILKINKKEFIYLGNERFITRFPCDKKGSELNHKNLATFEDVENILNSKEEFEQLIKHIRSTGIWVKFTANSQTAFITYHNKNKDDLRIEMLPECYTGKAFFFYTLAEICKL